MGKRTRFGVLGAGHLGRIHVQQALQVEEFEVIGVFDTHPEKRDAIAAEFGIPSLSSMEDLLAKCDVVDVVTPTLAHFHCAKAALLAGKHVFIEKPLTHTLEEGRELVELGFSSGTWIVLEPHVHRNPPAGPIQSQGNRCTRGARPDDPRHRYCPACG